MPPLVPHFRPRGLFFLGHHPWLLLALLVIVVALVVWNQRNRRH